MPNELLTLKEAVRQGISVLRRDPWAKRARIELDLHAIPGGFQCGPWVTVKDGSTEAGLLDPPQILLSDLDMDERAWEPWFDDAEDDDG